MRPRNITAPISTVMKNNDRIFITNLDKMIMTNSKRATRAYGRNHRNLSFFLLLFRNSGRITNIITTIMRMISPIPRSIFLPLRTSALIDRNQLSSMNLMIHYRHNRVIHVEDDELAV